SLRAVLFRLCLNRRRTNVVQYFFAECIGVALAGLGKSNDLVRDDLLDIVGARAGLQSRTSHLEGDAHDARSLLVEFLATKVQGDRHGALSHRRGGSGLLLLNSARLCAKCELTTHFYNALHRTGTANPRRVMPSP